MFKVAVFLVLCATVLGSPTRPECANTDRGATDNVCYSGADCTRHEICCPTGGGESRCVCPAQKIVNCFVNPCQFARCHPCVPDYCGGCGVRCPSRRNYS